MKKRCLRNVFVAVLLPAGILFPAPELAQNSGSPIVIGERLKIQSQILNQTRPLIIGKPASYETGEDRYPVLYLLDGDSHFHHTTGSTTFLAINDRIPEVLVVALPSTDRTRDLTPPSQVEEEIETMPTHGGADNFLRFMSDELMPWVEQHYRTQPYRILVGHSYGGLFAVHTLITRPEVFNAYIAISPSLQWNDQGLVAEAETFFEATPELHADFFMTAGNEGGALLDGVRKLTAVLDTHAPQGLRWDFTLMREESHGSVPHRSTYQGLETIFADWHLTDVLTLFDERGIEAIDEFYERSGTRFGFERTIPVSVITDLSFRLIDAGRVDEAAAVLLRDPEAYPPPSTLLDMLAAAFASNAREELAIEYYSKSLEVNPGNQNARRVLTEMGVDLTALLPQVEVAPELLASFVGTYELPRSNILRLTLENGVLVGSLNGGPRIEHFPVSETTFYVVNADVQITFDFDEAGEVYGLTVLQFGQTQQARKTD